MFARATRGEALVQANTSCVRIPPQTAPGLGPPRS